MIQHRGPISGVSCSKKFVATAGYDNQVILWDRESKTPIGRGLHDHLANRCEISADERYLVSASSDYTARLWQLPEMRLKTVFGDHTDDVEMIRFSPCQTMLATVSQDGSVRIFTLEGRLLHELKGHLGVVSACAWSADGQQIVSSGDDGTIRTWDARRGHQIHIFKLEDIQTDAIAILPNGVVFAGNDAGELIRIENGNCRTVKVHRSGIKNLTVSPNGSVVATMSYDRDLALVNAVEDLSIIRKIRIPALIWARACVFQDENHLIFGTFGSSYASLNLIRDEWDFSEIGPTQCLNAVSAWHNSIYAVGDSGQVMQTGKSLGLSYEPVAEMGSLCNFLTSYQNRLVCGGHLGKVFDAETGEELLSLKSPINKAMEVNGYLVLATYVGHLVLAKLNGNQTLDIVGEYKILGNAVKDLCADNNRIFCAGAARDIGIFDLDSMRVCAYKTDAHENIVNSCVSLGDGRFATVSRDLFLHIWNGTQLVAKIRTPHDHSVKCAQVSDDRRFVATGSYDGKLAIFDRLNSTWPVLKKVTAAGISSLIYDDGFFYASSYDGQIYKQESP